MPTAKSPTLDQVLALVGRLSGRDRARLMVEIAEGLAEATPTPAARRFRAAGADRRHLGR